MNLKQLLAIPLAFALSWVIAYPFSQRKIYYLWAKALSEVNSVAVEVEYRFDTSSRSRCEALQRWLGGTLLPTDPKEMLEAARPNVDPWGNSLKVTELIGSKSTRRYGIYSLGRDGKSMSNGNDPDDINSWAEDSLDFYQIEAETERRIYRAYCAIPFVVIVYSTLFYLLRSRKQDETEQLAAGNAAARDLPQP